MAREFSFLPSSRFSTRDGVADAVCGMATDITERKRIEEALSASALAVSQSEEEDPVPATPAYLTTILGVDGAFIATFDPARPGQLRVLAFLSSTAASARIFRTHWQAHRARS